MAPTTAANHTLLRLAIVSVGSPCGGLSQDGERQEKDEKRERRRHAERQCRAAVRANSNQLLEYRPRQVLAHPTLLDLPDDTSRPAST